MTFDDRVSIIVPTFRRPDGLAAALESLKDQAGNHRSVELIVADNDPDGGARERVFQFADRASFPVHYVHAPQPGVANARNAALAKASGRYIAFLDDDQTASPDWLAEMLLVMQANGCCAVFSRIVVSFEKQTRFATFYRKFFAREFEALEAGVIDFYYGCGSSLIDREAITLPEPAFSAEMNETGGEDDVLFDYLHKKGGVMGWTRKGFAYEHVPDSRLTVAYIRKRSFAFGQGPTRMSVDLGPFDPVGMIRSMLIGAGQFGVYGLMSLLLWFVRPADALGYLSKAYMGAGKVLWQKQFRPKLYGAASLKKSVARETVQASG